MPRRNCFKNQDPHKKPAATHALQNKACAWIQDHLVQTVDIIWELKKAYKFVLEKECLKHIHATCGQGHNLFHEAVLKNYLKNAGVIL